MFPETLITALINNKELCPDKPAFTFMSADQKEDITNSQLWAQVVSFSLQLQNIIPPQSKAIILLPPGKDYLISFLGCLATGIIAIPAYPPHNNHNAQRVYSIIQNSQADLIITNTAISSLGFFDLKIMNVDKLEFIIDNCVPQVNPNQVAFLQYTSGSTGNPKGVIVSHENIIFNAQMIHSIIDNSQGTVCSWLPPFHDMGLIGTILYPLIYNLHSIQMSPLSFIKRPYLWLKAISANKVVISPAPNFAYDLCVKKVTDLEKETLDLSCWKYALNGAEPVNKTTLNNFYNAFKTCGFKYECFMPAYGMAEATLIISGKKANTKPTMLQVDKKHLYEKQEIKLSKVKNNTSLSLVGCGYSTENHTIKIIDPQTCKLLKPYKIGEIVFSGPTITSGYWGNEGATQATFSTNMPFSKNRYLRTGDLGFINKEGELFVTGRIKDLLIIHGQNIYPQDIEYSVSNSHPSLVVNGCAALILENNEAELIIIQEINDRNDIDFYEIYNSIIQACAEICPILPADIFLIPRTSLPKTSSGKVQRNFCGQLIKKNELKFIHQWKTPKH